MKKQKIKGVVKTGFLLCFLTLLLGTQLGVLHLEEICPSVPHQDNIYGIPVAEAQATADEEPYVLIGPACRPTRLVKSAIPQAEEPPSEPAPPEPPPPPPPPRPRRAALPVYTQRAAAPEVVKEEPPSEPAPAAPPEAGALLLQDSDNDGFTDMIEQSAGTDPQDAGSHALDQNENGIDDSWEAKFKITQSGKDSDGDGLYDALEYLYDLDPTQTDADGDGFSDAEEILNFRTDPKDAGDPGTFEALGVRITGFDRGQVINDNQPLIKGVAAPLSTIEILVRNANGEETLLGETKVSDNGGFLFRVPSPLEDGEYEFTTRLKEKAGISFIPRRANAQAGSAESASPSSAGASASVSSGAKVTINTALGVVPPKPTRLGDQDLNVELLAQNLRVEIRDQKPVLVGTTDFRNKVVATWSSVVLTSALIADSAAGDFEIQASQNFEAGEHLVYVQAIRPKDNAMSKAVKIPFIIVAQAAAEPTEQGMEDLAQASQTAALPWIIGGLVLIAACVLFMVARRKKNP